MARETNTGLTDFLMESGMAKKRINYRFERAERERLQAQRKAEREARRAQRRGSADGDGAADPVTPVPGDEI